MEMKIAKSREGLAARTAPTGNLLDELKAVETSIGHLDKEIALREKRNEPAGGLRMKRAFAIEQRDSLRAVIASRAPAVSMATPTTAPSAPAIQPPTPHSRPLGYKRSPGGMLMHVNLGSRLGE